MTSPKNIAERETPPTPATPERTFPIQGPTPHRRIPWWLAEEAYASYSRHGTTQSLEMLAARGGFGAEEMDMFAPGWSDRLDHVKQLQAELTRLRAEASRLREAATEFLSAWSVHATHSPPVYEAVHKLRSALASSPTENDTRS